MTDEARNERVAAEIEAAWAAGNGARVARILREEPELQTAARVDDLHRLLVDPEIDPGEISIAGWRYLKGSGLLEGEPAQIAARVSANALALSLLREDFVADADVERALTAVRWSLLSGTWRQSPALADALIAQAAHNGGAWPFEADERAALPAAGAFAAAYLPPRATASAAAFDDPVTQAVAAQYEAWPYPVWSRITRRRPTTLSEDIQDMDPDGPPFPAPADILIAGCGSGRQIAMSVAHHPADRYVAIDLSGTSLRYAKSRCEALGLSGVEYHMMDLHDVHKLGRRFDAVIATGVLHHLPDPEAGWAALAGVLKPSGAMHVMVYSSIARLRVLAVRRMLADLETQPVDDDLLRTIRRRVLALPPTVWPWGRDFYTLAGVHDLLLHRHEDPFDLPRITRALDALALRLMCFVLPTRRSRERYREKYPHDPLRRDVAAWGAMERESPALFAGMYNFWCRKPA